MASEAQKKASAKYDKKNTRSILLKLNTTTDADILEKLDCVANRQGYVKELVRADIKGEGDVLSFDAIRMMIKPTLKKYGIQKAFIFGSYARGEAKEDSDVDLVLEGSRLKNISDYLTFSNQLKTVLGKEVDVVSMDTVRKDASRAGKRLYSHIEREKVLIYESD